LPQHRTEAGNADGGAASLYSTALNHMPFSGCAATNPICPCWCFYLEPFSIFNGKDRREKAIESLRWLLG
jgi:hypothetical protein